MPSRGRELNGNIASVTRGSLRVSPVTRTHHNFHPGTTSVLASISRTRALERETSSIQATEATEGRTKEKQATTVSSLHKEPTFRSRRSSNLPAKRCAYCPEKKKNRTPGPVSGSASQSTQTPRTADRGRLTYLTGRETRDAPCTMTCEFPAEDFKFC